MGSELPIPEELHRRMIRLRVNEGDLVERFIRGSGPGGQKINKTSSCVQIKHIVSGIEVKCQKSRSLMANRITARLMICSIIEEKEATGIGFEEFIEFVRPLINVYLCICISDGRCENVVKIAGISHGMMSKSRAYDLNRNHTM